MNGSERKTRGYHSCIEGRPTTEERGRDESKSSKTCDQRVLEGGEMGALEILLELLNVHLELGNHAPLMQTVDHGRWMVVIRSEATGVLR